MKQSEFARAGVVWIVPKPELTFRLVEEAGGARHFDHMHYAYHGMRDWAGITDDARRRELIDIWNPAFAPCTVEFETWDELDKIISEQKWRDKSAECMEFGLHYRNIQLVLWHKLFSERMPALTLPELTKEQRHTAKVKLNMDL